MSSMAGQDPTGKLIPQGEQEVEGLMHGLSEGLTIHYASWGQQLTTLSVLFINKTLHLLYNPGTVQPTRHCTNHKLLYNLPGII